jgi:NAD-dependent dihydropyrimidine dehydrogenase PreA subunit
MKIIYFSGTGNTKHITKLLSTKIDASINSIEDENVIDEIKTASDLIFAFPIYSGTLPKFVYDFIVNNSTIWDKKNIFILTTCGLVPSNGNSIAGALFKKYNANIFGSEYFKMPDSIGDIKFITTLLPVSGNQRVIFKANEKVNKLATLINNKKYPKNSFKNKVKEDKLIVECSDAKPKIDETKCINCGLCKKVCPSPNNCTLCYRCYSMCPKQAITILGDKVIIQYSYKD